MRVRAQSADVAKVTSCLSNGWTFLSGERRTFEYVHGPAPQLDLAEFCYFLPLAVQDSVAVGGVGVFIGRADAHTLAVNMFGESPQAINTGNLNDACAEACNVLADCVTRNITQQADIVIGLPFRADCLVFAEISGTCEPVAIYQCNTGTGQLFVIAYEIPRQS
jgi:hypothetical protein